MCVDVKPGRVVGGDGLGEGKGSDSDANAGARFECGSEPPGSGEGDPVNDFFFFFLKSEKKRY